MTTATHTKTHAHAPKEKNERESLPYIQLEEKIKKALAGALEKAKVDPVTVGTICVDLGRADTLEELETLVKINSREFPFLNHL
ncbi:MAG: hypothetical protein ABIH35_01225 [Patescibacteria group bacterium]